MLRFAQLTPGVLVGTRLVLDKLLLLIDAWLCALSVTTMLNYRMAGCPVPRPIF